MTVEEKPDKLDLVLPCKQYQQQVEEYRDKFPQDYDIPGASGLQGLAFDEWLTKCEDYRQGKNLPDDYVPATLYLAVRKDDSKVVGMLHIRHNLNSSYLARLGGHIGYSVAPEERCKGYGTEMLRKGLLRCTKLGIHTVMVSCFEDNIGSAKVIKKNNGVFIREEISDKKTFHIYHINNFLD